MPPDAPSVYCSRCWREHHHPDLPLTCTCGHVLLVENLHPVTQEAVLVGQVGWRAIQEIEALEDQQVFDILRGLESSATE